jgi:hypothetical protein
MENHNGPYAFHSGLICVRDTWYESRALLHPDVAPGWADYKWDPLNPFGVGIIASYDKGAKQGWVEAAVLGFPSVRLDILLHRTRLGFPYVEDRGMFV